MPAGKLRRKINSRARKRRGGTIGKYRPKYNLNTLQLSNVRPSNMRIPVQVKQQFFCRANASSMSSGVCMFLNLASPIAITHTVGGTWQKLYDSTNGTNNANEIQQLAAMYQHGHVLGAKAEYSIKFLQHRVDTTNGGSIPDSNPNELVMGVYSGVTKNNTYPTSATSPNALVGAHNFRQQRVLCSSQQRIDYGNNANSVFTAAGGTKRINGQINYSPRKILGVKDVVDVNDLKFNLGTATGAVEETFGCINVQHDVDTTSAGSTPIHKSVFNDFYLDLKVTYLLSVSEPSVEQGDNLGIIRNPATIRAAAVPFGGGTML